MPELNFVIVSKVNVYRMKIKNAIFFVTLAKSDQFGITIECRGYFLTAVFMIAVFFAVMKSAVTLNWRSH